MNHHPILEALNHIDPHLIEDADKAPRKMGMHLHIFRPIAAILAVVICIGALCSIEYIQSRDRTNDSHSNSVNSSQPSFIIYSPEQLVERADVICEGTVIDISFYAKKVGAYNICRVYTVYTIAVVRTYKGQTLPIEQIHVNGQREHYQLLGKLCILNQKDPLVYEYKLKYDCDESFPKIGGTYLFCLKNFEGKQKRAFYPYYALTDNPQNRWEQFYSPAKIKEYLPYVPHPLLVRLVICGAALAILLPIQARLKKKKAEESSEDL